MDWDDFKFFTAVAHSGSVRAAAQQLGVHASTVTRRIDQFENRLGVHLFNRSSRGLTITPEGAEVIQRVERIAEELGDIETQLKGRDQRLEGRVRVALPDLVAVSFLLGELAQFNADYPGVEVELMPSYQGLDVSRREADVAIRATNDPPEALIGRPLSRFAVAAYGSRSYVDAHGVLADPRQAVWVDWATRGPTTDFFIAQREENFPGSIVHNRCDNAIMHLAAVKADLGLAILPCALADREDDLVRLPQMAPKLGPMIWLLTHPELRSTQRVQVLMEFIRSAFAKHGNALLGVDTTNA
jgi:DNA-binding transcriptional LysR family regulator